MYLFKGILIRLSQNYHSKTVSNYWSKAPKTHYTEDKSQYDIYAKEIAKLITRYLGTDSLKILDHGAGEGSVAMELKKYMKDSEICVSEKFEQYRLALQDKGFRTFDADNLTENEFDAIYMNGAFFYVHPKMWKTEINRLLLSLRQGGYLFLTDVPTVKKIPLSREKCKGVKKAIVILLSKVTQVYQPNLGGFYVDERKIKKYFPQTIVEDEWCAYRSIFVIKKS